MDAGGRATQEAKAEYRLRAWDNITQPEERNPTLFTQPKSRGSGDCLNANNSKNDQDATDDCMDAGGRATQEQLPRKLITRPSRVRPFVSTRSTTKYTGMTY